jgi:hypothetical protein
MESFCHMKWLSPFLTFLMSLNLYAQSDPIWSEGTLVPETTWKNPYGLDLDQEKESIQKGRVHALQYPVSVTGLILPERPFKNIFNNKTHNPFRKLLNSLFKGFTSIKNYQDLFRWVGLHEYPTQPNDQIDERGT